MKKKNGYFTLIKLIIIVALIIAVIYFAILHGISAMLILLLCLIVFLGTIAIIVGQ